MAESSQQHPEAPLQGLLGISDPDAPIYRIFPLWFFEEALRLRQLVLVAPQLWEDPYEVLTSYVFLTDPRTAPPRQESLGRFLRPAYVQCWSRTEESDTLLRAYSRVVKDAHFSRNTCPRDEGVRVRSSPRRLLSAVQKWTSTVPGTSFFIGAVQYTPSEKITQYFADWSNEHGLSTLGKGKLRAQSLLLKRPMFSHEAEVRLISVDERDISEQNVLRIPFDPSEVFEEVTFDPRLETFERRERESVAKSLGYGGPFKESKNRTPTEA